jgi:hypothetical protein
MPIAFCCKDLPEQPCPCCTGSATLQGVDQFVVEVQQQRPYQPRLVPALPVALVPTLF